jgi:hypothetical protein
MDETEAFGKRSVESKTYAAFQTPARIARRTI